MNNKEDKFDVIIIGSGIGALSCASILSQLHNKKVLILERHFKVGGFTHTFKRQGNYEWDVGVHYIGEMQKGELFRAIFDYITQRRVRWNKMPDVFDVFIYPDLIFKTRSGKEKFKDDLVNLFPDETESIENYFDDIKKVVNWFYRYCASKSLPGWLAPISYLLTKPGMNTALMTTREYLNRNFKNSKLKAILASQWGTIGIPPSSSAFTIHGLIVNHYMNGGYYPVGGAKVIADNILPIVEGNDGKAMVNHEVEEIIIENGRATGVKVNHKMGKKIVKKEFSSDIVISDAGADATYNRLLPETIQIPFREECKKIAKGISNVTLYIGLKDDPRTIGLQGENYWIYSSYDHEQNFSERNELINNGVSHCYLSFPSLKNPRAKSHTAEIVAFLDYEPFKEWEDQPWKNRDAEYEKLKERIAENLIEFTNSYVKGFKELIDYSELATPLSTISMMGHKRGYIYGLPTTPERYRQKWLGPRTPIKNLYLTGADTLIHGIAGAMLGGVLTAGIIMGVPFGIFRVIKKIKNEM